jgi:deoxyadenosine/deoxycytidine kinase
MVIGVVGNIASGKSTVVELLEEQFGWRAHQESFDENPFLASFYSDPKRWSLSSQLFFLAEKAQQGYKVLEQSKDMTIWDSPIQHNVWTFAQAQVRLGNCTQDEWMLYQKIYSLVEPTLPKLDAVYWVRTPLEILESRIVSRGRSFEQGIPQEYLRLLDELNSEWVSTLSVPVIEVDSEALVISSVPVRAESAEWLQQALYGVLGTEAGFAHTGFASASAHSVVR